MLGIYDRYLVILIPFLYASIATLLVADYTNHTKSLKAKEKFFWVLALVIIGFFFVFSVCGTRDYLTWNRARWEILNDLTEGRHMKAEDIDGGFEFNGLHAYTPDYQRTPDKSWWWVQGDKFVVAFGSIPGYSVIQEHKYRKWMSPTHDGSIVLLEKNMDDRIQTQTFSPPYE